MNVLKIKKGDIVAKRQDKVLEWYLVQEGTVVQKFGTSNITLEKNSIIGILEDEWFLCDYIAETDVTLIIIPCKDAEDLQELLSSHDNYCMLFLRAALEQEYKLFRLYQSLQKKCGLLHSYVEEAYNNYKSICDKMLIEEKPFSHMDNFEAISMTHQVGKWEISGYNSLVRNYLKPYITLMTQDESLCVCSIMDAAAKMRRVVQGIWEMIRYLEYNCDILWTESGNDLFHLYFELAIIVSRQKKDITEIDNEIKLGYQVMEKLEVFSQEQLDVCKNSYLGYDFEKAAEGRIDVVRTDCVTHILNYAGFEDEEILETKKIISEYMGLTDSQAADSSEAYQLRRRLTKMFYKAYCQAFIRSMEEHKKLSPIMVMFFNFGFMDVKLLGEENTNTLYNLTDHLKLFASDHVFTIYEWLRLIYKGKKEPSRNEFDLDFRGYLLDLRRQGSIDQKEMDEYLKDNKRKVEFEIQNMFQSAHRMTYGRVTSFCPLISEEDMINSVEKMAVTAEKLEEAINKVREIDYSILYREVMFTDPDRGITQEWLMKEVMPDMILMPDVGTKGVMWQETSGAKTDTPGRFMFPIFTAMDIKEQMVETLGRYRWEICRRIQGVHWNDVREHSLTSEYYDYIQFYRKNSELSAETKEKIKSTLSHCRNNYREVFVRDYVNWMKYEAKGSFRLNKVARAIFIKYCPFCKEVRKELTSSPVFQNAFNKLEIEKKKKLQRLQTLYEKYQQAGGEITSDFKENQKFYQL